ncbi:GT4 family glycosyltransferase PelF [Candidatus Cetobacterium colombiensis]|uniref:GT4 family glycosyltransferase PelF n=1 Tax=Candidatus Cetobacterium colombiensis TaxID=3073100 RepID=A0ABU4W608_9FUSO|nr:GT4 family glycosyltransferase PelF [Candidatus Cetobacterium colombiensis]MDX8334952.1 GT4 family glycosyltransferase PelF [Candidatus Cetobacterium colombiensis]
MARVCLICEGSYPYVVGGVSSWIQDLVKSNEEHEFSIVCIIPNLEFAKVKYEIPKNIIGIKNIILDKNYEISPFKVFKNKIEFKKFQEDIKKILNFKNNNSKEIMEVIEKISNKKYGNSLEIIINKSFWNSLIEYYEENYKEVGFNTFYWTYRNIFLNLISLAQEEMPLADIYHPVATGYSGYLSVLAKLKNKGSLVLTEHGIYPREREEEVIGAKWIEKDFKRIWIDFFYFLSRVTYDECDKIISLFHYNRELQVENGAERKKCEVIPNGIDLDIYLKIKYEKRDGFNIGSVLRVVPIKDVKMMLKGFKMALSRLKDTKMYLIGPTEENEEYYKECLELVKNLQLEEYVIFTGRTDVKEYYKFLDVLMLTSISEGQPLSILEGLASGIPFIATDVGNCREILTEKEEGEAGIIVPPTSYADLGEAIVSFYQNREKIKDMGKIGREIVKKYYSKKQFIDAYKKIYKELGEQYGGNRI